APRTSGNDAAGAHGTAGCGKPPSIARPPGPVRTLKPPPFMAHPKDYADHHRDRTDARFRTAHGRRPRPGACLAARRRVRLRDPVPPPRRPRARGDLAPARTPASARRGPDPGGLRARMAGAGDVPLRKRVRHLAV